MCWIGTQHPSIVAAGCGEKMLRLGGGGRESDVSVHIRNRRAAKR